MAGVQHVQVDGRRVVHDVGVVLAGEDVACAAHVGGQLVDFVEAAVDDRADDRLFAQVAHDEIVGLGFGMFIEFQVNAADPEPLALQALHKVAADESTGPANQSCLLHRRPFQIRRFRCKPQGSLHSWRGVPYGFAALQQVGNLFLAWSQADSAMRQVPGATTLNFDRLVTTDCALLHGS